MAIYMGDILIKGSFPPQVHLYAQGATLLFMVLGWSLIWEKDVSFPNLQATHLDFYPSWLCSGLCLYDCSLPSRWGLPDCCLCAGVWMTLSLCIILSVFLAQWSLCVQCSLLDAAQQCFSDVVPGSISFCLLP